MPVTQATFELAGRNILSRNNGAFPFEDFRSLFGSSVEVVFEAWCYADLGKHSPSTYFGLSCLRRRIPRGSPSQAGWCSSKPTFRKWVRYTLTRLTQYFPELDLPPDSRWHGLSHSGAWRGWRMGLLWLGWSPIEVQSKVVYEEVQWPGVRYEIAICIQTGKICWAYGHFPCGKWPDSKIFQHKLQHELGVNEMVEADRGYTGLPFDVRTPDDYMNEADKIAKSHARARHEIINRRLKQWGCLGQKFRHDLGFHQTCFRAVVMMTQLAIIHGEPVAFDVEY
ncbi:expressed unknown protein [Seminavis robusta]|uniref:DDE Tnp4 domain-containing protein n=1 Tax=Seminavis robusta TaxID=568900 RepID=A0A9N8HDG1_9STRA|nr:expressed unknown protein [Seminavis robusta]|eukprot:Sro342_g121750.1 n/a (281) ;mRNA; f:39812-40751